MIVEDVEQHMTAVVALTVPSFLSRIYVWHSEAKWPFLLLLKYAESFAEHSWRLWRLRPQKLRFSSAVVLARVRVRPFDLDAPFETDLDLFRSSTLSHCRMLAPYARRWAVQRISAQHARSGSYRISFAVRLYWFPTMLIDEIPTINASLMQGRSQGDARRSCCSPTFELLSPSPQKEKITWKWCALISFVNVCKALGYF